MAMVQKAKPQNQSVQDLFDVYSFGLKYDQAATAALSSSGRVPALLLASPKGAQPDLKSPNSKYVPPHAHAHARHRTHAIARTPHTHMLMVVRT